MASGCGFKSSLSAAGGLGPSGCHASRSGPPAGPGGRRHRRSLAGAARPPRPGPQAGTVTSQAWVGAAGVTVTVPPGGAAGEPPATRRRDARGPVSAAAGGPGFCQVNNLEFNGQSEAPCDRRWPVLVTRLVASLSAMMPRPARKVLGAAEKFTAGATSNSNFA